MKEYEFKARAAGGKSIEGSIFADDINEARKLLHADTRLKGYTVAKVTPKGQGEPEKEAAGG